MGSHLFAILQHLFAILQHLFAILQPAWKSWDVGFFVLLSLFLQSFLLLIAPFRKRGSSVKIYVMVWLTYSLADWTAIFAAGLIADTQKANIACSSRSDITELMAFWSTFLLVHLGGPDTITAFALEDNELWLRHLLKLIGQLVSTGLVFYRSLSKNNELLVPTILMFIAGIIKCWERIRSLHRASVKKITNSLLGEADRGPNYAKLMEEYALRSEARMPVETKSVRREPTKPFKFLSQNETAEPGHREMIRVAYGYYRKFRGLVADVIFSRHESRESREYLVKLKADKAFKVVEIELDFIYQLLYTKAVTIHDRAKWGYFFRFVYSLLILITLGLWYSVGNKSQHFSLRNVKITYALLFDAIALETISLSMLVSSDRMTASAMMKEHRMLVMIGRAVDELKLAAHKHLLKWAPPILTRRWSESIQQFNLIDSCLLGRRLRDRLYECMGIQDVMDDLKYVTDPKQFCEELREFIFEELKLKFKKAEEAKDPKDVEQIYMDRGEWILKQYCSVSKKLRDSVKEVEFDESIILWHIATDLCYNYDRRHEDNKSTTPRNYKEEEEDRQREMTKTQREMSKTMSDYMLHLLIRESQMIADVSSIARIRFRDTVEEVNAFLQSLGMDPNDKWKRLLRGLGLDPKDEWERPRFICNTLWNVNTDVEPRTAKGDRSKSLLFDGCCLAKELCKIHEVNKWELICKVWVEMLSYAAIRCRGHVHAAQLGKGGQLLTLVWLLMNHLGLGMQFRINEGSARIKFVADN